MVLIKLKRLLHWKRVGEYVLEHAGIDCRASVQWFVWISCKTIYIYFTLAIFSCNSRNNYFLSGRLHSLSCSIWFCFISFLFCLCCFLLRAFFVLVGIESDFFSSDFTTLLLLVVVVVVVVLFRYYLFLLWVGSIGFPLVVIFLQQRLGHLAAWGGFGFLLLLLLLLVAWASTASKTNFVICSSILFLFTVFFNSKCGSFCGGVDGIFLALNGDRGCRFFDYVFLIYQSL